MTAGTACGTAPCQYQPGAQAHQHQLIINMAQLDDERAKASSYQHSVQRARCVRATAELQSVSPHTSDVHILGLLVPGICSAFHVPLSTSYQYGRKYKYRLYIISNTSSILIFPFTMERTRHERVQRTVQQDWARTPADCRQGRSGSLDKQEVGDWGMFPPCSRNESRANPPDSPRVSKERAKDRPLRVTR